MPISLCTHDRASQQNLPLKLANKQCLKKAKNSTAFRPVNGAMNAERKGGTQKVASDTVKTAIASR